jgi:hypothetical protein
VPTANGVPYGVPPQCSATVLEQFAFGKVGIGLDDRNPARSQVAALPRRASNCAQRWGSDCQSHAATRSAPGQALTATAPPRKPASSGVVMHSSRWRNVELHSRTPCLFLTAACMVHAGKPTAMVPLLRIE